MWEDFPKYEKLLWKLVWKWMVITRNRFETTELFNELVIVYVNSYRTWTTGKEMVDWRGKPRQQFQYLLGRTCWSHLCDYVIRSNRVVTVSIEDVIVEARQSEFEELWTKFFFEALDALVTTENGKFILDVILHKEKGLEKAKELRMSREREGKNSVPRNRMINKEDLRYYFTRIEGMRWQDYKCGMLDLEGAFHKVLKDC